MKDRETLMSILAAGEVNGVLDGVAPELILEVLIDIRDLLISNRGRTREVITDFVPSDYGKEDQL